MARGGECDGSRRYARWRRGAHRSYAAVIVFDLKSLARQLRAQPPSRPESLQQPQTERAARGGHTTVFATNAALQPEQTCTHGDAHVQALRYNGADAQYARVTPAPSPRKQRPSCHHRARKRPAALLRG